MVLVLSGVSLLVLSGAMTWTSTSSRLTARNNDYFATVSAAEAATEKILTRVTRDYQNNGESTVYANLGTYRSLVPNSSESTYWEGFEFNNAQGTAGRTFVERIVGETYTELNSQYSGLRGWASTYRILSNARKTGTGGSVPAAVNQDVQIASIPVFQFAIFYGLDLELHSLTTMNVVGRVHGNGNIYTSPSAALTFSTDVTSVGKNFKTRKPGDPAYTTSPPSGSITYKGKKDTGVSTMSLPIGTNNEPSAVHAVIEVPPSDESPTSTMGKERYYNKAELVLLVKNTNVTALAKSPLSTTSTTIPWTSLTNIISTNTTFTDQRENKTVRVTQVDVSKLAAWSATNSAVSGILGGDPVNIIYIADQRTTSSSTMNAVRLINGQTLPSRGLTVATLNPLYVKGHFNQPTSSHLGTTNTSNAKAASLISDAITVLSPNWSDSASSGSYSSRNAASMTVNAAILTGIVETSDTLDIYSGGAHNLCRFLENWSSDVFTCNGSMVVLFPSQIAIKPFQQPGAYYDPPARNYSFDLNYQDAAKLPPGTPQVRALIRNSWAIVKPGTTNILTTY
jgi:hypothetical protein